jgi:hypothetical protein
MRRGAQQRSADAGGVFDTAWVVEEGNVRLWKPTPRHRIAQGVALIVGGAILAAAIAHFGARLARAAAGEGDPAEPISPLTWRLLAAIVGAAAFTGAFMLLRREAVVRIDPYMVAGSCPGRRRKRRTRWWREDIFAAEVKDDPLLRDPDMRFHLVLVHARGGRWVLVSGSDRAPLDQLCASIRALMGLKKGK